MWPKVDLTQLPEYYQADVCKLPSERTEYIPDINKLILVSIDDEIVDVFLRPENDLGVFFYCQHNNLELVEILSFCGFVQVITKWK